jgi:copper chaperone CopZ
MSDRLDIGVNGMTCDGCVNSVKRAVGRVPGVAAVAVDLAGARAVITGSFDAAKVVDAIRKAGFEPGAAT